MEAGLGTALGTIQAQAADGLDADGDSDEALLLIETPSSAASTVGHHDGAGVHRAASKVSSKSRRGPPCR
jgi:hypothetical protein